MNELFKFLFLNIGKIVGVVIGILLAFFILFFGVLKTLFIIALVILGYILGKWHDEGFSLKKIIREFLNALKINKWQ